jgi:exonuclease III
MIDQHCVLLSWNARGLNNKARRQVVKDLVTDTRATVVAVQETKLQVVDQAVVLETFGARFVDNFVALPADGVRGGILLAVDEDFYTLECTERGVHCITALIKSISGQVQWNITVVYGPQEDNEKLMFLAELRWMQQLASDKWLIIGDFNLILQAVDKSNSNLNRRLIGEFRDVVQDLELKELNLRGRKFTWTNDRTHTRIDRAFCSAN